MSDYIDRKAALRDWPLCDEPGDAYQFIRNFPAADVRPVVRGEWENNHCSACGMMPMGEELWECCEFAPPKFEWFMNFCPNCGAEMLPTSMSGANGGRKADV